MIRKLLRDPDVVEEEGFRLRGLEMTRLETFIDAAFAFAVTMLALDPDGVPASYPELMDGLKSVPAMLASLAILMIFWRAHERYSRRYGLEDATTVVLSVGLIAAVLTYVYPLKFMCESGIGFFIPPLRREGFEQAIGSNSELANMFLVYGVGWMLFNAVFLLLFLHAYRKRKLLELDALELHDTVTEIRSTCIYMGIGGVSVVIAIVATGWWIMLAGFIHCVYGALIPLNHAMRKKRRDQLFEAVTAARANPCGSQTV